MELLMNIEEMIALALSRGELELAELLKEFIEEPVALVIEFPDYRKEQGILWA